MDAGLRVDELGVDANRIGDLLNRPLENVRWLRRLRCFLQDEHLLIG